MNVSAPRVSVIVPAYNQAVYLQDSLNSVLHQTYTNWECFIVDDGSSDETAVVAKKYLHQDARFHYFFQTNKGLSGARNTGLRLAQGAFIQFLDADDVLEPAKLQIQTDRMLSEEGARISFTDYYITDELLQKRGRLRMSPKISCNQPLRDMILHWGAGLSIPNHCFLFDAGIFKEDGFFFSEQLTSAEDWHCWVRLFQKYQKFIFVRQPLAGYRVRRQSMTRNIERLRAESLKAIELLRVEFRTDKRVCAWLTRKERTVQKAFRHGGELYRYPRIALRLIQDFWK